MQDPKIMEQLKFALAKQVELLCKDGNTPQNLTDARENLKAIAEAVGAIGGGEKKETYISFLDRLGQAYCRLNRWEWDEILGPKPEGFDALPNYDTRRFRKFRRPVRTKEDYITPALDTVKFILGPVNCSRYWWKYACGETNEKWLEWCIQRLPKAQ